MLPGCLAAWLQVYHMLVELQEQGDALKDKMGRIGRNQKVIAQVRSDMDKVRGAAACVSLSSKRMHAGVHAWVGLQLAPKTKRGCTVQRVPHCKRAYWPSQR